MTNAQRFCVKGGVSGFASILIVSRRKAAPTGRGTGRDARSGLRTLSGPNERPVPSLTYPHLAFKIEVKKPAAACKPSIPIECAKRGDVCKRESMPASLSVVTALTLAAYGTRSS
jgi:hypothetical protein